jgi:hypothetical protein
MPISDVSDWLRNISCKGKDFSLTVTLEISGDSRQGRESSEAELENLVADPEFKDKALWEKSGYCFNFLSSEYAWQDKDIYITANEALFLFRWLIQGNYIKAHWFYLRNMRRRLGKEFLFNVQTERQNQRAAHEDEEDYGLDGKYL